MSKNKIEVNGRKKMTTVKYQKNNNLCPFCNDRNFKVIGNYEQNNKQFIRCYCEDKKEFFNIEL